ncbi:MAG: transketolase [Chloroflexota bacterium]|nr:MAG: transketolase [Chloroflexota bacterium]
MVYTDKDKLAATTMRMMAIDAVQAANSGHPGLPLGAADIAFVLWTRFLKHDASKPTWPDRDRFVLSAGHGSALLYSLLHLTGYPLSLDELRNFRQWGSLTPGHPEYDPEVGVETTTGPLGQGLANAVGMALAERILAAKFNRTDYPIVNHYTYVIASDGDLMEGVSHEAASLAGHLGLNKLIVLYDDNNISIDGPTDLAYSDDAPGRFAAYGWHVQSVNGHDMEAIDAAIETARNEPDRPSLIACRTHIGLGSPGQDTAKVHGSPLGEDGVKQTKVHFGWDPEVHFHVPEPVSAYLEEFQRVGAQQREEWEQMVVKYRAAYPELGLEWDRYVRGELNPGWEAKLPDFSNENPLATRSASGKVLNAIASDLPTLVGGSADLTPSNNTRPAEAIEIKRDDYSGRYIHFGVREHGMGSIMNGLALHGMRPYGGTFLIFSDYLRPTIRLAAMMGLPVVYVFTHDSIGLGEDGPTHQPVEHLTSLRVIPNLLVIRPADGNETSSAWKVALNRTDGPTALVLTRQGLPQFCPADNGLERGAYVLKEENEGDPEAVIIATGSEVSIAIEAAEQLSSEGKKIRVVSMPSWELFDTQAKSYRDSVLPPEIPRLAVEAGVSLAWGRYLDLDRDIVLGVDRFGASAPYKTIFDHYGLTTQRVVDQVKKLIE